MMDVVANSTEDHAKAPVRTVTHHSPRKSGDEEEDGARPPIHFRPSGVGKDGARLPGMTMVTTDPDSIRDAGLPNCAP
jgi:hypothetical protein